MKKSMISTRETQTPMTRRHLVLGGGASLLAVAGCADNDQWNREAGNNRRFPEVGTALNRNVGIQSGEIAYAVELGRRFAEEVPTTINFAFNSTILDAQAQDVLRQQAHFIRNFPEVRFSVFGHTDLVGSAAYNQRLGRRRAQAAVNFLVAQGIDRSRLEALVSFGETQPIVATDTEERRNRRTVTEVSGFVQGNPLVLDGQYARIIYRTYAAGPSTE